MDTWNMSFRLDLLDGATMIMPGDQATIRVTLPSDMPIFVGQKYTMRENSLTVATGIVTKLCNNVTVVDKSRLLKVDVQVES